MASIAKTVPGITFTSIYVESLDEHFTDKKLETPDLILQAKMALESKLNSILIDLAGMKKITSLNVVSLAMHFEDLNSTGLITKSDILCLNETRIDNKLNKKPFQIPGYTGC